MKSSPRRRPVLLATLLLAACTGTPEAGGVVPGERGEIRTWGTMRDVLRNGHSEGRVAVANLGGRGAVGVGALAELAGEITIVDDRALVATASGQRCVVREATADDRATLLVHANVPRWRSHALPDCADYAELEGAIAAALDAHGFDRSRPTPVRVRGDGELVAYHVIAGACPIANPTGPAPWRFAGSIDEVELVGVYVEGAAGRLTHHTRVSHLHCVAPGHMGHLDEVALTAATLLLPAAAPPRE